MEELLESFTKATILTPHPLLSTQLYDQYEQLQLKQKKYSWHTPDILPISSWLKRLWLDYVSTHHPAPLLLNSAQEFYLWQQCLSESTFAKNLLQLSATIKAVQSARKLYQQAQIFISESQFNSTQECKAFYTWNEQFEKYCKTHGWLDQTSLPNVLAEKISYGHINAPQYLILIGFVDISPQLNSLLDVCRHKGTQIEVLTNFNTTKKKSSATTSQVLRFHTQAEEITTIARFTKHTLFSAKDTGTTAYDDLASFKIACIFPDLNTIDTQIKQIFNQVFYPNNSPPLENNLFSISTKKKITDHTLIHTALQILLLYKQTIKREKLSFLLSSPYLGDFNEERFARAQLDVKLKDSNITHLNLKLDINLTLNAASNSLESYCPLFMERIKLFYELSATSPNTQSYSGWRHLFSQLLTIMGWPNERQCTKQDSILLESWLTLLDELTTLDYLANKNIDFESAYAMLKILAEQMSITSANRRCPIQILTPPEAIGLDFDYLWIANTDNCSWPSPAQPSPYLPKHLQSEYQLRHASNNVELFYYERLTQHLMTAAPSVYFSFCEIKDALEVQISSLVAMLPEVKINDVPLATHTKPEIHIYESSMIEMIDDHCGPAIDQQDIIQGGVNILKQQALCPFKSFAQHRLHARSLAQPTIGLSARDRGIIIHKVLELFWHAIKDQQTLLAMPSQAIHAKLQDCINSAFQRMSFAQKNNGRYLELEKTRLLYLLDDWLTLEKQRESFSIEACEKSIQLQLNEAPYQLNLSLRIDRIDNLGNGKKIIIDYKTNKTNNISNWFSERPDEPQLPLYVLFDSETIGITFAELAKGEQRFKGVSRYNVDIKGIKALSELKLKNTPSWQTQISNWQSIFQKLAQDFFQGMAKVNPKNAQQTCLRCDLKSLCRINSLGHTAAEEILHDVS